MYKATPRVDIAFKKIFGVEENKDLLISLINSIVSEEDQVADVMLLNPYNLQSFYKEKLSILDIKARGINDKLFNIEIQITDTADYDKRALYYWAKLYAEQIEIRESYSKLAKAIGIHILNFNSIVGSKKYHNVFHITEKETGIKYFDNLELHTIELPKFIQHDSDEELRNILKKVKTSLDAWITFLTRYDLLNKEDLPREMSTIPVKKALTILEVMNFTREEREAYEGRIKWLLTEEAALKKATDDGRAEGIAKGKAEGRAEGMAEGIAYGRVELIKKMLAKGNSIETISQITDLSIEEIAKLKL